MWLVVLFRIHAEVFLAFVDDLPEILPEMPRHGARVFARQRKFGIPETFLRFQKEKDVVKRIEIFCIHNDIVNLFLRDERQQGSEAFSVIVSIGGVAGYVIGDGTPVIRQLVSSGILRG